MQDKIKEFVRDDINPALAMHDGHLEVVSYDEESGLLHVKLGGRCTGCAASTETLKIQIESFLKEEFPEVKGIVDETDHDTGDDPYYKR